MSFRPRLVPSRSAHFARRGRRYLMKMEAQAKGVKFYQQAEGFEQLVKAAGGEANDAIRYMVAEKS